MSGWPFERRPRADGRDGVEHVRASAQAALDRPSRNAGSATVSVRRGRSVTAARVDTAEVVHVPDLAASAPTYRVIGGTSVREPYRRYNRHMACSSSWRCSRATASSRERI